MEQRPGGAVDGFDVEVLVARAQRGDASALVELQSCYRPVVLQVLGRRAGAFVRARIGLDDLEQIVHAAVFLALPAHEFRGASLFRSWIRTITLNVIRREANREGAERRRLQPERLTRGGSHGGVTESQVAGSGHGPVSQADLADQLEQVSRHVPRLKPTDQQVIALFVEHAGDMNAIAGVLGITPDNARTRWNRARRRLAKLVLGENDLP